MGSGRGGPGAPSRRISTRRHSKETADDMTKRQVIFSMLLTVLSVFCLAVLWEFWLEPALEPGEFESESNTERWDFVVTSVAFAAIALIIPSWLSLRNIAGRARAEVALRRAKDLAETASRTKSRFLATMSH